MNAVKAFSICFYKALVDTIKHDGIEHAGYLAFVMLLSLFPFLMFIVAIAGFIGNLDVGRHFIQLFIEILPHDLIAALEPRAKKIASGPPQGLLTLAIIGIIWTASSTVEGLRTILNRAYRVHTPPHYIWRRLLSIGEFLLLTMGIFVIMFFLIFAPILWENIQTLLDIEDILSPIWTYIRYGLSTFFLFLIVATLYFILPNIKQTWRSVAPGSILVVIGWVGSAAIFSETLKYINQVSLVYGSLGGIIIALIFFYIINMILIFGAEFNMRLEMALGHKIEEKE